MRCRQFRYKPSHHRWLLHSPRLLMVLEMAQQASKTHLKFIQNNKKKWNHLYQCPKVWSAHNNVSSVHELLPYHSLWPNRSLSSHPALCGQYGIQGLGNKSQKTINAGTLSRASPVCINAWQPVENNVEHITIMDNMGSDRLLWAPLEAHFISVFHTLCQNYSSLNSCRHFRPSVKITSLLMDILLNKNLVDSITLNKQLLLNPDKIISYNSSIV